MGSSGSDHSSHFGDFIAGSFAGITSKLFEYPFDTVKVLQQTTYKGSGLYNCISGVVKQNGVRSLYNGLLTPLLSCTLETAVLFYFYEKSKSIVSTYSPDISNINSAAISGMIAGTFTPLIVTPVEFVKCNLQVQGNTTRGPLDCVAQTLKKEGIRGMYRGYFATVMREAPGSSLWFATYETSTSMLTKPGQLKSDLSLWQLMAAGSLSGIAYWSAFFPADVVKTQIQTSNTGDEKFWKVLSNIWRTAGVRGLYRGYFVTVCRAVPSNAILFASYELCKRLLNI